MASQNKNQSEGYREAAEKFNKEQQEFVDSKQGKEKTKQAGKIEDNEELRKAEEKGKARAKANDPAVVSDYDNES